MSGHVCTQHATLPLPPDLPSLALLTLSGIDLVTTQAAFRAILFPGNPFARNPQKCLQD
ncbi:hypothetical protein J6590_023628 [Homalodisca vitripennis]|nr:hypothetical protein J6590_023628 [Homalodisca vitripennis]